MTTKVRVSWAIWILGAKCEMHLKVKRASPLMLSCLPDLLDSELSKWKATWCVHVLAEAQLSSDDDTLFDL